MKTHLVAVMVVTLSSFSVTAAEKATAPQSAYLDEVMEIADGLGMKVEPRKPLLPQVIEMRDELRVKVNDIARMSSRHTFRCKRARRDLMKTNALLRRLRDEADK